jgi:alpha-1,2-mannosyltransferase
MKRYKRFTLIAQSLGSIVTVVESLVKCTPEYFIGMFSGRIIRLGIMRMVDTLGHSFTYPFAKLFGSKVVAYVHYPTIRYREPANMRHV